jgi:hypothetical protein
MTHRKRRTNTAADSTPSLVRQEHGGALLAGGVPGHLGAGGRPREVWRQACRDALEEADGLGFVMRVIKGEVGDQKVVGEGDATHVVTMPPKVRDRLYAVQLLAEHGHGKPPQELQVDDAKARPTGEALVARVLELLPRVIAMLPLERKEIARLFDERKRVEVLLSGRQVKDDRRGNGDGARDLGTIRRERGSS